MGKRQVQWFLINENYEANLCPFAFHFDADYHGFKKILGRGCTHQSVGIFNGFLRQGYGLEQFHSLGRFIYEKLSKDRVFAKRMLKNIYDICSKFHRFNKSIYRQDLSRLTNRKLAQYFQKFYDHFFAMSTWSVPFSFTEYENSFWTDSLLSYLKTLSIPKNLTELEVYQILTTSKRQTYTGKEKESLLELAIKVKRSPKLLKLFKLSAEEIKEKLPEIDDDFWRRVNRHTKKFFWINFGFEGPELDLLYFISAIKDWLSKDPAAELRKERRLRSTIYQRQQKLLKKLGVDSHHRWLFWVVREFGFQKTYRKDIEYYSYYIYHSKLLAEFARRFHLTIRQAHYLLLPEILSILTGRSKAEDYDLNERIRACFYVVVNGKAKLLVGRQAVEFNKKIKSRPVPKNLKQLSGQCACKGQAVAEVKIIKNKDDYKKFNAGDILVSYATNPNMVPLMKKASAIITDEGGVTCHAAIVSRELNIPCVIGTRFATKILKDGQLVEVDATAGIVKIKSK